MNRIKYNEINADRVKNALVRRLRGIFDQISWKSKYSLENKKRIDKFHNAYIGKKCYLIANGPSLDKIDLNLLQNEYTIGLNRIYLLFDKLVYKPTFLVAINELVLDQFQFEIEKINVIKFLNWNRRNIFDMADEKNLFLNISTKINDQFSKNLLSPISSGGTVTFVALQIAFYLGFSKVIIIGLDHFFSDKGIPNSIEKRDQDNDINHFSSIYFPKGTKWQYPDLFRSELAYKLANTEFTKNNRKILDATVGGKCDVFEKVDFYKII